MSNPFNVFISYSHCDEEYRRELEKHLVLLKRSGLISTWSDRVIKPGADWKNDIDNHLEQADIFLCLVSQDFLASEYCYETEMRRALKLHDEGKIIILPILLRCSGWHLSPLAALQALPSNAKPIIYWRDRDEAWVSISKAIESFCKKSSDRTESLITLNTSNKVFLVAILGMTGTGKSSVINSLVGMEVVREGDVITVTRSVQKIEWQIENTNIEICDCPGLGEDCSTDSIYRELYDDLLKKTDLVIWIHDCSSRIISDAKSLILSYRKNFIFGSMKLLLVVNRVDLAPPLMDWDEKNNMPGRSQQVYIERRLAHLAGAFGLPTSSIITISVLKNYNIEELKHRIFELAAKQDSPRRMG